MFECHGWINVQESASADDDDRDDGRLRGIVEGIERRIREIDSPYLLDLRWMNGQAFVHFGGFCNHRDAEIVEFFEEVGGRAPGSYGLLHVRDDEDPARENEVLVIRMVRGRVSEYSEPLLSPCIPVIGGSVRGIGVREAQIRRRGTASVLGCGGVGYVIPGWPAGWWTGSSAVRPVVGPPVSTGSGTGNATSWSERSTGSGLSWRTDSIR